MSTYQAKANVTFGGISLSSYGAFAFYCNVLDKPERDVNVISVPGRNGDLLFDNGRYKNIDRIYRVCVEGYDNIKNLLNALCGQVGYKQLTDGYESDIYMMARLKEPPQINRFIGNSADITLVFDRMPQKFTGTASTITTRSVSEKFGNQSWLVEMQVNNQYGFDARPDIYIKPTARASGGGPSATSCRCNEVYVYNGNIKSKYSGDSASGFYPALKKDPDTMLYTHWETANSSTAYTIKCDDRVVVPVDGLSGVIMPHTEINFSEGAYCDFPVLKPGNNTLSFLFRSTWSESYTDYAPETIRMTVEWNKL